MGAKEERRPGKQADKHGSGGGWREATAGPAAVSGDAGDPATVIEGCWRAVLAGTMPGETAFRRAASPVLARQATEESVARLVALVGESGGMPGEEALLLAKLIESYAHELSGQGRSRETLALRDAILPLLREHLPPEDVAVCMMNRASSLGNQGRHGEAVAGYDEALPLLRQHAPPADVALCLMGRATELAEQGRYGEAVAGYDEALPLLRQHAPPADVARCLHNRAHALGDQGRHDLAVAGYDEALPLLRQYAPPADVARCMMSLVNVLRRQGWHEDTLTGYDEALSLMRQYAPPVDVARCLVSRANALAEQGRYGEAVAGYDEALPLMRQHAPPADVARCLVNRANAHRRQGRHAEAVAGYDEARRTLKLARRVARIDEDSLEFVNEWGRLFHWNLHAALAADDLDAGLAALADAKAGVLGDLRARLPAEPAAEPADVLAARDTMSDWLRGHAPAPPANPRVASAEGLADHERRRMAFWAECDDRTRRYLSAFGRHHHAYDVTRAAPAVEESTTRDDIQACLPDRWAVLDFWKTGDDEFTAFVVTRSDCRAVRLPFPVAEFAPLRERLLRDSLPPDGFTPPNYGALGFLYEYLFRPLLPHLAGVRGLYLVPHDFLHGLPLHAAEDESEGGYLCDRYDVAYLPSAGLLPQLPKPDPSGRAFILADPEDGTGHALPFARWEGEELADMLDVPQGQCFFGTAGGCDATERLAGCGMVHFSCHGHGDTAFAPRSHLRLADGLLLAHDVVHRRRPLKEGAVVVLNGCQTGVADGRAVNEGMGMMTAFLLRGAGVVMATQWSVFDDTAAEFAVEFVRQVRGNASPARALRVARRHVRGLTPADAKNRCDAAAAHFLEGSVGRAKIDARRAWLAWRAGELDAAEAAAVRAAPGLRVAGLGDAADRLVERARRYRRDGNSPAPAHDPSLPGYWAAFHLVGRAV